MDLPHTPIKVGDLIIEFNGNAELRCERTFLPPLPVPATGEKAPVKILRDKRELTIPVRVEKLKDEEVQRFATREGHLGLRFKRSLRESLRHGIKRAEGVVHNLVEPASAADEAGLEQG